MDEINIPQKSNKVFLRAVSLKMDKYIGISYPMLRKEENDGCIRVLQRNRSNRIHMGMCERLDIGMAPTVVGLRNSTICCL